jgi:hypothetical protein
MVPWHLVAFVFGSLRVCVCLCVILEAGVWELCVASFVSVHGWVCTLGRGGGIIYLNPYFISKVLSMWVYLPQRKLGAGLDAMPPIVALAGPAAWTPRLPPFAANDGA